MKYHVTYFYLASGMKGMPDRTDCGIIEADSESAAKLIAANKLAPTGKLADLQVVMGRLSAERVA